MKNKNKIKEQIKRNAAITLVALVVTIVVLLILAGLSISLVIGDDGIIKKAGEVKQNYEASIEEEQQDSDQHAGWFINQINGGALEDETPKYTGIPDTNVTNPAAATPSNARVIEPDATKGIVISVNENEYVWVEVPRTIYENKRITSNTDYSKIEIALLEYAKFEDDYVYSNFIDIWHAVQGEYDTIDAYTANLNDSQKALTNGCGLTYDEYDRTYKEMLKSIYTYGGFWIGRYEAGISEKRTNHLVGVSPTETPRIIKNAYPYTWVTCSEAQTLANKLGNNITGYTSGLMFGIQWSLTIKFLETKGSVQSELYNDSTSWGNFYNNQWDVTNVNARWSVNNGIDWTIGPKKNESSQSILLTTGASSSFAKMNIYDLAGNVSELTLGYQSNDGYNICEHRGAYCSCGPDSAIRYDACDYNACGWFIRF